jgi:DNA polymerase III alpha subunit
VGQYFTVAFKARKTKSKKDMANMIASDHTGKLHDILVWPSDFESAKNACGNGMVWKFPVKEKEDDEGNVTMFLSLDDGRKFRKSASNNN